MVEDAEVENRISSITRSAKNLSASETWLRMLRLLSIVIVDDETVERSPFKKPNVPTRYLISLCSGKK